MTEEFNDECVNGIYDVYLKRNRRERLVDYAIGGVAIAILFTAAMFIIPLIPVALFPAPVDIGPVEGLTDMPVCPGDTVRVSTSITNRKPEVINVSSVVYRDETKRFIPGTLIDHPALPRPYSTDDEPPINTIIDFKVPSLLPGDYTRVSSFVSHNSDTVPVFMFVPFTVGQDCTTP